MGRRLITMKIEDHERIFSHLSQDGQHGKLAILDAPTGSGKSYSIVEFLCKKAMRDEKFRAFFMTDQKKNLPLELFKSRWKKQKKTSHESSAVEPFKKIAVIRSLVDTVNLVVDDYNDKKIPVEIKTSYLTDQLESLRDSLNLYKVINKNQNSMDNWFELNKAEFNFRKCLAASLIDSENVEEVDFKNKDSQEKIRLALREASPEIQEWVYNLYPTIDVQTFQIFLCTTDKFIRSYTPFFQNKGEFFLYSHLIEDTLVVLDEFDGTKKRIWRKSIDDALKTQADILVLFDAIYQGLMRIDSSIPQQLKDILTRENKHSHYLQIAEKLNKEFKLSYLYKVEGTIFPQSYVIHTPISTLVSDDHSWYSHFDKQRRIVVVDHNQKYDLHFKNTLNRVSRFIKSFSMYVLNCARKYMDIRNSKIGALDSAINQIDACWTVYKALRLNNNQIEMLMNSALNSQQRKLKVDLVSKNVDNWHEFQKNGLELYSFMNSEQHDLQTEINVSFFSITAENYLLALIKKCLIYGLSATASIPTVLDNYDIEYLKGCLGKDYIDGKSFLTKSTMKEFDYAKRYQDYGVEVQSEIVGTFNSMRDLLKNKIDENLFNINENDIKKIDSEFKECLNSIELDKDEDINYFRHRYMSLFESFVYFLLDSKLTSFLGLQSKLADDTNYMSQSLIEHVFNTLSSILMDSKKDTVKLCFISSSNGNIQNQLQKSLQLPFKEGTRVYLLSAYLSIGTGQNLQHDISLKERKESRCIALDGTDENDKRLKQIDLAGIYLGEVTHIFTKIDDFKLNSEVLKYVTELEYLQDANEIGPDEVKQRLRYIQKKNGKIKNPSGIMSLEASYTKVIVQALGRMNRTFNKVKNPLILANADVINSISNVDKDLNNFSPEFQALIGMKDDVYNIDDDKQANQENIKKQNLTAYSLRDINQLLYGIRRNDNRQIDEYKIVRKNLLEFPTISKENLTKIREETRYCLQYLSNKDKKNKYTVEIKSLNDGFFDFEVNNAKGRSLTEISSRNLGLDYILKYKGMKDFFVEMNYATEWKSNEYIMNPIQSINLYKGILGEKAGKFIFEDVWNIRLVVFDNPRNFELFDFVVPNKNVAIDFKNWGLDHDEDRIKALNNVSGKLDILEKNTGQSWKVIIANILGNSNDTITVSGNKRAMEISALIDSKGKLILSSDDKKQIGEFLNGK